MPATGKGRPKVRPCAVRLAAGGAALALLGAAGCASDPEARSGAGYRPSAEIREGADDRSDGPGLFSGEDGRFTLIRRGTVSESGDPAAPVKVERRRR